VKFILIALFVAFYLLMAIRFFRVWWVFFERDTNLSPNWTYLSIVILILASAFWPIVVPFAYLELLEKVQRNAAELEVEISETEAFATETSELEEEAEPENCVSSVEL
jgi:membrane protein YdbS with pleckstrin-like domain